MDLFSSIVLIIYTIEYLTDTFSFWDWTSYFNFYLMSVWEALESSE
jgi:hypothetical protein